MAQKVLLRHVKNTDVDLSIIGLGCMSLSLGSYVPSMAVDEETAMKVIDQAIELGINHFNTATFYGSNGHNELLLGKAIKKHGRSKFFIQSKFGIIRNAEGTTAVSGFSASPSQVHKELEGTLARLGTDYVDSYGPARVDPKVPIEETVKALSELVKEGKIRYLHLSEVSADTIRRAHAVHPITFVESEFSLWALHLREKVLPTMRELGISLLAYSPLGRGFLTGQYATINDVPPMYQQMFPRFSPEHFEHNRKLAEELEQLAKKKGITSSQLALAWVLTQGDDIFPIPGTKQPTRVVENVSALHVTFTKEELEHIESIISAFEVKGARYGGLTAALNEVQ